ELENFGIELLKKADKEYVDSELSKKADITYVDEQIQQIELTPGKDGREIELRVTETHIQWRYEGTSTRTNLLALSELKGADGKDGKDGEDGSDGREIELSIDDYIRWRYEGETSWRNLIAVNELKGQDGKDGREIELQRRDNAIQWRWVEIGRASCR